MDILETESGAHTPSPGSGIPQIPGGVTALGSRVLSAVMIRTGNKRTLDRIKNAPEWAGNKIGDAINAVFGTKPSESADGSAGNEGVELTQEQAAAIEKVIADNPTDAAQLFGMLLTDAMPAGLDAPGVRRRNLERYAQILNMIGAIVKELQTSLALRGFVHRDDCVSYWHFTSPSRRNDAWSIDDDGARLSLNYGLEVYLIEAEPTEQALQALNEKIRRSPNRRVQSLTEHDVDGGIAKLKDVYELSVTFDQLDLEPRARPFGGKPLPIGYTADIPNGAPALAPMLASLLLALQTQSLHEAALGATLSEAEAVRTKIKGWLEA